MAAKSINPQSQQSQSSPSFHTIFWYGERYYSAREVDEHIRTTSRELDRSVSKMIDVRSNIQNIRNLYDASSEYWTAIANHSTSALLSRGGSINTPNTDSALSAVHADVHADESATSNVVDSPRSGCSSNNRSYGRGGGGGAGGRAIGKRNQEFYIPHDVLLSHTVSTDADDADDADNGTNNKCTVSREWLGRYDRKSNIIIRFPDNENDEVPSGQIEYETLKQFAQEHDREMWQMCQEHKGVQEYRECNTPNVWTNPHFKFYNTVSLKWEPLSVLRSAN
jgi:hypothetical protein